MEQMEQKLFTAAAPPSEATGEIEVTWATLGVVDRDGDIILPEAVPAGKTVPIMQWGHRLSDLPIARGRLYLGTTAGKDHYEVLRERGASQEWSFSYYVTRSSDDVVDGRAVRVIQAMDVLEVSPVLIGAGIATRTDSLKSAGRPLRDHAAGLRADLADMVERAEALAALRAKEGRVLSAANRALLSDLLGALREAAGRLEELLQAADPQGQGDTGKAADARGIVVPAAMLDRYAALKSLAQEVLK
jgi:hypothetical protein